MLATASGLVGPAPSSGTDVAAGACSIIGTICDAMSPWLRLYDGGREVAMVVVWRVYNERTEVCEGESVDS